MELDHLKDIAAELKYEHHHNIGVEKLEKQLLEYCITQGTTLEEVSATVLAKKIKVDPTVMEDPKQELIEKLSKMTFSSIEGKVSAEKSNNTKKDALRLVRCTITCNNKNKTALQGEIFCASNSQIAEIKKYVPFGVITHVPQILFNLIKEKMYQNFRDEKINGVKVTHSAMVPEYSIQILDPITLAELEAIKRKQLAEGFDGE